MITPCPSSVHLSVHPHLWSTSSETPRPNIFKLHVEPFVKGGWKICTNSHYPLRWLPCPYMVNMIKTLKILQKTSSSEPRKLWGWILVHSIRDNFYNVFSKYDRRLTYNFFSQQGQIRISMHLYVENIEKSFSQCIKTNGWNLQWIIKVANPRI